MNMIGVGLDGVHEKRVHDDMHINDYHLWTSCRLVNMCTC